MLAATLALALAIAAATFGVVGLAATTSHAAALPVVYLTFDDGPSAYTNAMLDVLGANGAKATFFVVGREVGARKSTVARIRRNGHAVGNHSWNHTSFTRLTAAQIRDQVNRTDQAIRDATGRGTTCVRPPYGAVNSAVRSTLSGMGKATKLWTVDTRDWSGKSTSEIVASLRTARNGSVVLMHDGGGNRSRTVAAVKAFLQANRGKFQFKTLPGC